MRINKLHIKDFGKFHDKDISLTPGLNILYGGNEAGKTTTKDFIIDMLYGIDKKSGTGVRFDHYEKRRPINSTEYCGSMEVSTDTTEYLIERNFMKQSKRTILKDLNTGKDIILPNEHDLTGTVLTTDKSTYLNTLCIGQMETATDKEIADKLNNYIVNMASTKTGDIDAVGAIVELKKKKAEFSNPEVDSKIAELTAKLQLDRDYDGEITAVQEEYRKVEEEMNNPEAGKLQFTPIKNDAVKEEEERQRKLKEEMERQQEETNPLTKRDKDLKMLRNMGDKSILDNAFMILLFGILLVAVFVAAAYAIPATPQIKMIVILVGIVFALITVIQIFVRRSHLYKLLEELEIEKGFEEAKTDGNSIDLTKKTEYANKLSELKNKQEALLKERGEQEQYMKEINELKAKNSSNIIELQALDLAIKTIEDLSEEIYDSFGSILNKQVSDIIAKITENKYTEVKIDEQLKVRVKSGNSFISMEYLSTSTIEQIYLALRLSIANVLIDEDLPIIIDDIFVTYDEQRLVDALKCISEYIDRQIIILTTNPKVQEIFNSFGVPNYAIAL